jgi:hypothetical protein
MRVPFDPLPKAMEGDQGYQQKSRISAIFLKKLTTTFDPLEYIKSINMVIKEPISLEGDQNWHGKRLPTGRAKKSSWPQISAGRGQ